MKPAVLDTSAEWHADAMARIEAYAASGISFSADDLRDSLRPAPTPNDVGTVFRAARTLGLITCAGYTESKAPSRKGGLIRLWVGTAELERDLCD